ncbi:MAG: MT-A70 family methyltransferase [Thiobacillaceae bacterium]|nr:MT-A70 family methyltransferase [Thiobacillaceae bacterium]
MIYQVMPDLSADEFAELKADILARGVMVPVEYDEHGNVLDGHHRIRAVIELRGEGHEIAEWPRLIRIGWTEEQKRAHARALNLARRHLTRQQREQMWIAMRQDGMSYRQIAEADGTVTHQTVKNATVKNLTVDLPATVMGKVGKQRAASKPRTAFVSTEAAEKAQELPERHRDAVLLGAKKPMEAARDAKIEEIAKRVPLPTDRYRVVYADPPWSYGNTQPEYHTEQRDHYPVMPLADICDMPVADLADDDAVLFLWVTSPILEEAFDVIRAWGFAYKASFVWDKVKHNMGHYNSVRHELLLVCTRGSCQPDTRRLFDSVVTVERGRHSEKPAVFYEMIETLYPHGKRLELFARAKRQGWDSYGHEADSRAA